MEPPFDKETIEAAEKILPYIPNTIKELDSLGSTLVGAINSVLYPVYCLNEYTKFLKGEFKERLEQKKNSIPKERQTEIPKYLAYPVVERLKYSFDEEYLKNMYMNLLSSSMDKDNLPSIHPSFYSIIESLSHLDAEVFEFLYTKYQSVLSATLRLKIINSTQYYDIFPKYFVIELLDNIDSDPFLISSSITNLYRLGLLNMSMIIIADRPEGYKFTRHKSCQEIFKQYKINDKMNKLTVGLGDSYHIQLSDFGRIFGKICISND